MAGRSSRYLCFGFWQRLPWGLVFALPLILCACESKVPHFPGPPVGQETDFSTAGCVPYPLVDIDPNTPGIQPECQALERIPCDLPGVNGCLSSGYQENPRPECKDPSSGLPLDPQNPQTDSVADDNRPCWYLFYDTSLADCPDAPKGQEISVLRKSGQPAPVGALLAMQCLTCPDSDPTCAQAQ